MLFPRGITAFSDNSYVPPGRTNFLRTSHSKDNYSIFECSGNTISARGQYTGDGIKKLLILHYDMTSGTYSLHGHKDGSYEAELTLTPESGEQALIVQLNSGAGMRYRIFYEKDYGWYFPLNGVERSNPKVFEHIYEAPNEAAALYLSASDDPEKVNSALEQITLLTESAVGDAEEDYDKALAISKFISGSIYYDLDAREGDADLDTIALSNVLKSSKTVCGGFANLFCAMAEAAGLDAVNIKGGVTTDAEDHPVKYSELPDGVQNHEWAAFYCEKEQRWVWVDPCWEGAGKYKNGEFIDGRQKVMYFDITDEALSFNHRADKAERRHYFSAKTETSPVEETSGQPEAEETYPADETSGSAPDITSAVNAAQTTSVTTPEPVTFTHHLPQNVSAENEDNTVLIAVIAVLAAAVSAVVIIIIILIKKRKE